MVKKPKWFGVRCIFQHNNRKSDDFLYEERITIWKADSFEQAIELAEYESISKS